ncbi:hypothetical protein CNMCM8980_003225 [Aspergillus fumigatiaffinis]|nr:hypothetical protein CNMCM8980_003225 [Aspergillus fumigatiaffinis]
MSVQYLPDEVLLHILSYLPSHADAAALSLQCHRWHRLCDMTTRRKYRRVKLRETLDLAVAFKILRSILKTPQYGRYVRHIELNRSPSVGYGIVQLYTVKPPQRSLRPKDQERLTAAIRRAGFESPQEQEKMLNILLQNPASMDHHDPRTPFLAQALAALLVSVSPLLESLNLCPVGKEPSRLSKLAAQANGTPLRETDYFFKHFLDRANSGPQETMPFLQYLRKVRFLVDADTNVYRWFYYQPYDLYGSLNLVRRLPGVESIRVDAIMGTESPSVEPPPQSGNYTKITIRNSSLDYHHLVRVIESAKRLEEFTYAVGGRGSSDGSLSIFSPDHVLRALLLHGHSLLHLDLDVEAETPLAEAFDPSLGQAFFASDGPSLRSHPIYQQEWAEELQELKAKDDPAGCRLPPCSLRGFTELKNLSLGIHLLYYLARGIGPDQVEDSSFAIVDHLPPSLESLCIYGYEKGMKPQVKGLPDDVFDRQLENLLADKAKKLPRLIHIEGIDEFIENATTVEQPQNNDDDLWERETDDEWTDHEYD